MRQIKGMDVAAAINERIKEGLAKLPEGARMPKLAIIRVGERPDDMSYERGATKRMATVGIDCESFVFPGDISNEDFVKEFDKINEDENVDGILMLRPLPKQIDEVAITKRIAWEKDVDCISPTNMAKLFMGDSDGFAPCTPEAVIEMLDYSGMPLSGKNAVVIGRSMVVGKPLSMLLLKKNCTVTICHTRTVDMPAICRKADIVVAAAGKAYMVDETFATEGTTKAMVDVGINWDEEKGKLCGDISTDRVMEAMANDDEAFITPVPGGVGSVTTSVLASHVFEAYCRKYS